MQRYKDVQCKAPGDAPPKLVCQFCSYSTVYSTTMVRHVRTHTGERPYRCVSCKKGFTTQQQLEKHCSQPLKPCYKPFECNYCSERFPTDTMLTPLRFSRPSGNGHFVVATSRFGHGRAADDCFAPKKFQCKLCHYSTNIMTNLKHHIRVHSGERPFKCNDCGKGFIQKIQMIKHSCLARPQPPEKPIPPKPSEMPSLAPKPAQKLAPGLASGPAPRPAPESYEPTKRPYSCSQCGETFTREMQFLQHVVQVHTMR
ncbi:hypothetical protein ISCGN_025660 [Ixodes scapularis]